MNPLYNFLTANLLATFMAIIIGLLIAYIVDLKKRIRALRYCYMNMSDFCIDNIDQAIKDCSESVNQAYKYIPADDTSYEYTDKFVLTSIIDARQRWEEILDYHERMFKSVGLKSINKSDYDYLLE